MVNKNMLFHKAKISSFGLLTSLCLGGSLLLTGCHTAKIAEPMTKEQAGNDPDVQLDFWHNLAEHPVTSNDEAFHGVLLYLDQNDPAEDYNGRVALLKSRKLLPDNFDKPAEEAITRGTLAIILVRALEIKGGLIMHVFGPSGRYATRELMYMNLYPPSSPNQTFSGSEFLGIIGRIEDYQRVNPAQAPAALLPGEIEEHDLPPATTQPTSAAPAEVAPEKP